MRNLKYSLLLSASLLVNVQICWAMIEEDTVSHEFGSNSISYRKGRFEPSSEGSTLYTTPHIPGGIIQSKQVDNNISECLPIKTIPMQVGKNQDERVQITQTTDYPHRIHGQLKIRIRSKSEGSLKNSSIFSASL
jgi:V8-like Glu-specific endopeptidase